MTTETQSVTKQEQVVQKQEDQQERTVQAKYFIPTTDIVETDGSLIVSLDIPGVKKENVSVKIEKNVLEIDAHIDSDRYSGVNPVYTEYNVGHYSRKFTLSNVIDQGKIEANLDAGVLMLTLPKVPDAEPRRITVN